MKKASAHHLQDENLWKFFFTYIHFIFHGGGGGGGDLVQWTSAVTNEIHGSELKVHYNKSFFYWEGSVYHV